MLLNWSLRKVSVATVEKNASFEILFSQGLVFFSTLGCGLSQRGLFCFSPGISEPGCSSLVGLACLLLSQFTSFSPPGLGAFSAESTFLSPLGLPLLLRKIGDPPPSCCWLISVSCANNSHHMSPGYGWSLQ